MLELFAKHGGFDLTLQARGDLDVDQHHTVEDAGIVLGQLFAKALGDRRGHQPRRLFRACRWMKHWLWWRVDLSGRPALVYKDRVKVRLVGDLQIGACWRISFGGFVNHAGANLHAKVLYGRSNHHKIEADLQMLCASDALRLFERRAPEGQLPSTKGLL